MNVNEREIVLDILLEHENKNKKSHLLIRDVLDKYDYLDVRKKAFIKRVSEGTILKKITLDYIIDRFSTKPVSKCKPEIRAILRMSVYQLLFMEKVPANAVTDEAVKLCKKRSMPEFTGFINANLRAVSKGGSSLLDFSEIEDRVKRLSVQYSCPEFIVRMFIKEQKEPEALLSSLNEIFPTSVKIINEEREEAILKAWRAQGISYKNSPYINHAYLIDSFDGTSLLDGFNEGDIIIEDQASMLAGEALGIGDDKDALLVDVCAAPGGKSVYAALKLRGKGSVISRDLTESKVSLIRENKERLKLDNLEPQVFDATVTDESLIGKADYLICDLPCSGLGVMGRKSDIRYNVSNESMKAVCDLQKKILDTVTPYLKVGGVLVYSTCTIHRAENEKTVKYILDKLPFRGDSLKPYIGKAMKEEAEEDYYLQLLPNIHETDGFFISRFIKTKHDE